MKRKNTPYYVIRGQYVTIMGTAPEWKDIEGIWVFPYRSYAKGWKSRFGCLLPKNGTIETMSLATLHRHYHPVGTNFWVRKGVLDDGPPVAHGSEKA